MNKRKSLNRREGFSLVEIALALGIIGVALTSMLGLMPIGLKTFSESIQSTVQTDALRELSAQFQSTPFDQLVNDPSMDMIYFSDQGIRVTNDFDGLIGVKYEVLDETPILANGGYVNTRLKTVKVYFFDRKGRSTQPPTASATNVIFVPPGVN